MKILILGATSAIAAEVASLYAKRGDHLHLVGRNSQKLADVAARTGPSAAKVTASTADFSNLEENERVVAEAIDDLEGLDTVLIAHGDLGDQLESERSFSQAEPILTANFTSVVSLLIPIANYLAAQKHGKIGVITSVAGDRGRPRNYTYGAAKGALHIYLQGLRTRLYAAGVTVTTLKLGPVDTPMTRSHKKNALFGKVPSVAKDIVAAVEAGVPEAYVPKIWGLIMPVVKNTPEALFQKLPFLSGR